MSSGPKNERSSSVNRRNGCYSYFSTRDVNVENKSTKSNSALLTVGCRSTGSSTMLTPTPTSWNYQCQTPPPPPSIGLQRLVLQFLVHQQLSQLPIFRIWCRCWPKNAMAAKHGSFNKQQMIQTIQAVMDRYIQIKRKLRPLNTVGNKPKINRTNKSKLGVPMNQFSILAETDNKPSRSGTRGSKVIKAPPIYIRKKSSKDLVNDIVAVVGQKFPCCSAY